MSTSRRSKRTRLNVVALDEITERCQAVLMLAELMIRCHDHVPADTTRTAGLFILREVNRIDALAKEL